MVQQGLSTANAGLLTSRGFNNTDTTEYSDQDLPDSLCAFPALSLRGPSLWHPHALPLLFSQPLPRAWSLLCSAWVLLLRWFGNVAPDTSQGIWEIPPSVSFLPAVQCLERAFLSHLVQFSSCSQGENKSATTMEWNGNLTYGFTHWKKRHKNILEIYSTSVTYKNLFTFAIIEWSLKKKVHRNLSCVSESHMRLKARACPRLHYSICCHGFNLNKSLVSMLYTLEAFILEKSL